MLYVVYLKELLLEYRETKNWLKKWYLKYRIKKDYKKLGKMLLDYNTFSFIGQYSDLVEELQYTGNAKITTMRVDKVVNITINDIKDGQNIAYNLKIRKYDPEMTVYINYFKNGEYRYYLSDIVQHANKSGVGEKQIIDNISASIKLRIYKSLYETIKGELAS